MELEDREFAVHVIMKIRRKEREQQKEEERGKKPKKKAWKTKPTKKIREFKIPAIVWQSEQCRDMVRARDLIYEPPITHSFY